MLTERRDGSNRPGGARPLMVGCEFRRSGGWRDEFLRIIRVHGRSNGDRWREDNLSKGVEGVPGFFLDPCKSILLSLSILAGSDAILCGSRYGRADGDLWKLERRACRMIGIPRLGTVSRREFRDMSRLGDRGTPTRLVLWKW